MQQITPSAIAVREVRAHVGWYRVMVCVQHVRMEMLTAVDGMAADVHELSVAEREGFAKQAVELAVDMLNTCVMPLYDMTLILPGLHPRQGEY